MIFLLASLVGGVTNTRFSPNFVNVYEWERDVAARRYLFVAICCLVTDIFEYVGMSIFHRWQSRDIGAKTDYLTQLLFIGPAPAVFIGGGIIIVANTVYMGLWNPFYPDLEKLNVARVRNGLHEFDSWDHMYESCYSNL